MSAYEQVAERLGQILDWDTDGCPVCGAPTGGAPCERRPAGAPEGTPSCADLFDGYARLGIHTEEDR